MSIAGFKNEFMKKPPTISASIITYNEEDNIKACLDSLTDLVDEIIVLDSYSTDATEKICRSNPKVKFFQHTFDDFLQQKNRALEKCSSQWILNLDADEIVSPELKININAFLSKNPDVAGVKIPRLSRHLNRYIRHGGWYPNARYRLVQKGMARWGGNNVHAHLVLNGTGKKITGDIIHFTYRDLSDHVIRVNNYSSTAALTRYNNGKKFRFWRLFFKPVGKFFETYLFKLGLLDGIQGLIISVIATYSTFLNEAKHYELDVLESDTPSNLSSRFKKKR